MSDTIRMTKDHRKYLDRVSTLFNRDYPISSVHVLTILCVVFVSVSIPNNPSYLNVITPWRFPIEFPLIVVTTLYWKNSKSAALPWLLSIGITSLIVLRLLDFGFYLAFDRAYNFLRDGHLIVSAVNLLQTGFGQFTATLVIILVIVLSVTVAWIISHFLKRLSAIGSLKPRVRSIITVAMLLMTVTTIVAEKLRPEWMVLHSAVLEQLNSKVEASKISQKRSVRVQQAISSKNLDRNSEPVFDALKNHDVVIIFVESYGRSFLSNPVFAPLAAETLQTFSNTLKLTQAHVKSSWLRAPVSGGQSWLSHATLHAGVTIEKQADYERLVASKHLSLARLFERSGWSSMGMIPGIQSHWPEGEWYGFNRLYTHGDFNYSGKRFGYITMPDQFTLAHFNEQVQSAEGSVMATIALLSSHAPWNVLPKKLPWSRIENGSVYDGTNREERGTSIFDLTGLKHYYAKSIQYSLQVVSEFINNYERDALFIVLGDHQPAAIIGGLGNSMDVPVHLISKNRQLITQLPETTWSAGVVPNEHIPPTDMAEFRSMLMSIYQ